LFRLLLVRHGTTVWNAEGRLQGHTDVPLSAEGVEQARLIAERLRDEKVEAVWTSDLSRARSTAEAIAEVHGLPVHATPALRETMLGVWEGLTEAEIVARGDEEHWRKYRRDPMNHRPPNSESLEKVWERLVDVEEALRREHSEGNVVVIGHGGSLGVLLCDALDAPHSSRNRFYLDNAGLSIIEYVGDRVWVRLVNDTSHLRNKGKG
jgi:broad specificity phosphatase PhoE